MKIITNIILLLLITSTVAVAQTKPLSERIAVTAMTELWKDAETGKAGVPTRWTYEFGVVLKGIEGVWYRTGERKYFEHIKNSIDAFVNEDGTIRSYSVEEYNIDHVLTGRMILFLYKVTGQEKYRKAADLLRSQLKTHPRTNEGGFWHKKIYPYQMWLDGLYMGEPFYVEYASTFGEQDAFNDIANQFVWMEKHARDAKTGLLYHGWDESKQQRWANKTTGLSPHFWGRAMGWYAMGLVDTLDYFPKSHPRRAELVAILNREAEAIKKYQDAKSGLWWQILDKGSEKGNYLESSCAAMFVYALAKGVRNGYLPESYMKVAEKGYAGINAQFIENVLPERANFTRTVSVAGLGGNPYRDGSYEYYLSERVVTNDPKGVGAVLQASVEMEMVATRNIGKGKTVLLDDYFNQEIKTDKNGHPIVWHYKWNELPDSGFNTFGKIFNGYGAKTEHLSEAPTAANLKNANIYIIVDPDTEKETAKPNYIEAQHIKVISDWVKSGGVLLLMGNDFGNCEFEHFNQLVKEFGVQFNKNSINRVQGNNYIDGQIMVSEPNVVFKTAKQLYLKELSTLSLSSPAKPLIQNKDGVIMATVKFGRGTVFVVGDPWLYNEYVDGRRLPPEFENFKAANDLAVWLIRQSGKEK